MTNEQLIQILLDAGYVESPLIRDNGTYSLKTERFTYVVSVYLHFCAWRIYRADNSLAVSETTSPDGIYQRIINS